MGTIFSTVPERYLMIQRPIQLRIIQSVLDSLNLTSHFAVGYVSDDGTVTNPNSLLGEQNKDFVFNTKSTNRVLVNFEESEESEMQQSAGHLNILRNPLWYDNEYGVSLTPKTAELKGEATFSFLISGRNKAELFYNRLRRRLAITNQFLTNAEYRIPVSDEFLYVVDAIRELVQKQFEPDLTTLEYIKRGVVGQLINLVDHKGNFSTLAFREVQNNILLQNIALAKPEINRNEEGVFEVTLGVSYFYQTPIDYYISYPELVGELTVPSCLLNDTDTTPYLQFLTNNDAAFSEFAAINTESPLITYPKWDTFVPPVEDGEYPWYSVITKPAKDKITLIDLTLPFDKYVISPVVLKFLIVHLKFLNDTRIPLIGIKVFRNEVLLRWDQWHLTPSGEIVLSKPSPDRYVYRVVIYGLLNWFDIDIKLKRQLQDKGKELLDVLPVFLPDIDKDKITLAPGGQMETGTFEKIAEQVNKRYSEKMYSRDLCMMTVGLFHLLIDKE